MRYSLALAMLALITVACDAQPADLEDGVPQDPVALASPDQKPDLCTTIQSGELVASDGSVIETG